MRAYVHEAGLKEAYRRIDDAGEYLRNALDTYKSECSRYKFILAALWGRVSDNSVEKVADFFGLSDISDEKWPGNPDVSAWVVKNGIYVREGYPQPGQITCGDTIMVLGEEEKHRRECASLTTYATIPPGLESIGLKEVPSFIVRIP